jgi:hypothetical protein
LTKQRKRLFQEHGLARAGTGDQAHDKHSGGTESLAQGASRQIILFQNVLPDFD